MPILSAFPGGMDEILPGTETPKPDDGEGAIGESENYARADHVHPAENKPMTAVEFDAIWDEAFPAK